MKQNINNYLKNILGWKTKRKLLIFSVDDFGNVRLDSKIAREKMDVAGLQTHSIYDKYDTLESSLDLEALFETLKSVKDINHNNAVFTPYAVPCNLNFEKIQSEGYTKLFYETLNETYSKLELKNNKVYKNSWSMWKEGISSNILMPQFHGREHLNVKTINDRLIKKDKELLISLKNNSLTSLSSNSNETSYTVAFGYQDFNENLLLSDIIKDGLNQFEKVFGYRASCFMPPSARISPIQHKVLSENGIKLLDTYAMTTHQYSTVKSKKELRWTGKKVENLPMAFNVRNAVFEPILDSNALEKCKKMIDSAFFMNKPAIVSSHRINFVGSIDESIRKNSLTELKELLKWVIRKHPDVEFISMHELQKIIYS